MPAHFAFPSIRRATLLLLCAALTGLPAPLWAAASDRDSGAPLLRAQLPAGVTLPKADCLQIIHAVSLAVRAHRSDAPGILSAALTRGGRKDSPQQAKKWPCTCVDRMLRAALVAAPEQASTLLEVAISLAPECVDSLQDMVQRFDDKNVVDDNDGPFANAPSGAQTSPVDANDPETEPAGFGVGFGPGFPGSPGFTGSPPTGAIALPVSPVAVTSDVNG